MKRAPPDQVWHGIASELHSDKRKRQIGWIIRIAASIAVLLALGTSWFLLREPPETQLVTRETPEAGTREESRTSNVEVPDNEADVNYTEAEGPGGKREMNVRTTGRDPMVRETQVNLVDANIPGDQPYMDPHKRLAPMSATRLQTDFRDPDILLTMTYYPSTVPRRD